MEKFLFSNEVSCFFKIFNIWIDVYMSRIVNHCPLAINIVFVSRNSILRNVSWLFKLFKKRWRSLLRSSLFFLLWFLYYLLLFIFNFERTHLFNPVFIFPELFYLFSFLLIFWKIWVGSVKLFVKVSNFLNIKISSSIFIMSRLESFSLSQGCECFRIAELGFYAFLLTWLLGGDNRRIEILCATALIQNILIICNILVIDYFYLTIFFQSNICFLNICYIWQLFVSLSLFMFFVYFWT